MLILIGLADIALTDPLENGIKRSRYLWTSGELGCKRVPLRALVFCGAPVSLWKLHNRNGHLSYSFHCLRVE